MAIARQKLVVNLLLAFAAVVVALPFFWFFGGIRWLETRVFPPRRPKNMPQNAIWIDAPELPISWHHGWWFGCQTPSSGTANRCRVVMPNGSEVYAGDYLPCRSKSSLAFSELDLVPPPDGMWIADKRLAGLAPIGALRNGDLLVPVLVVDRCDEFKGTQQPD
jgi:hypothetical protein